MNKNTQKNKAIVFEHLFESLKDCILILNQKGIIQKINKNGIALLGYEQHEMNAICGHHITQFFVTKDTKKIHNKLLTLNKNNTTLDLEATAKKKNTAKIETEVSFTLVPLPNTFIILAVIRNISLQKTVASMLESHDEHIYALIDTCPVGFLTINSNGEIIDANKAYVEMSGYSWQELIQMKYFDLLFKNSFSKIDLVANGNIFEIPHKNKNGEIMPVKIHSAFFENSKIFIFVDNISDQLDLLNKVQQWRVQMDKILDGLTNKEDVGILIAKSSFGLAFANDFICKTFGYTKDELLQQSVVYLTDWKKQSEEIDKYYQILNGDVKQAKMKLRFVRKDRSIFITNTLIINHGDNTVLEIEDIQNTGEVFDDKHNDALMKTVAKFNEKDKGLLVVSTKEGISYANKIAYETFGYNKIEMLSFTHPSQFTYSKDIAKLAKKAITVYTGISSKAEFPIRFFKKDGNLFNANLTLDKHKEKGIKYLILQFDNIEHLDKAAAG